MVFMLLAPHPIVESLQDHIPQSALICVSTGMFSVTVTVCFSHSLSVFSDVWTELILRMGAGFVDIAMATHFFPLKILKKKQTNKKHSLCPILKTL